MGDNMRLKKEIQFFEKEDGIIHMYDARSKNHYKIGQAERMWLSYVDGTHSEAELRKKIPSEYYDDFTKFLHEFDLLEKELSFFDKLKTINIFKLKVNLMNIDSFLSKNVKFCVHYRNVLFVVAPLLFVLGLMIFSVTFDATQVDFLSSIEPSFALLLFYLVVILITGFVHEFSHALVAKSYGVNVPTLGMMLFYINPAFFVDVSGINFLSSKTERIKVVLAGCCSNMILFFFSVCMIFLFHNTHIFFWLLFIMNMLLILANLVPFVEYDGYFIFINLIEEHQIKLAVFSKDKKRLHHYLFFAFYVLFSSALLIMGSSFIGSLLGIASIWMYVIWVVLIVLNIRQMFTTR
jgi:putative peptide zinc metalloprotease protein